MVLYHAADLLWATKIKKTGEARGIACRPVRSIEMLDARLADSPVRGLVVDLDAAEAALELIRALRARPAAHHVRVLAFGPHIATEALEQARIAGADVVLARGAFDRRLDACLSELDAPPAS